MKPIDPSVDELMWLLAEQNEVGATESFCRRYPDLRAELHQRIRLVSGIRANKTVNTVPNTLPPFAVRPTKQAVPYWPAVALIVLFASSYAAARFALRPSAQPVATVENSQPTDNPAASVLGKPTPTPGPNETARQNLNGQAPPAVQPTPELTPMQRRVTIPQEETTLVQILNQISLASGVQFQLAPGVSDMPLSIGFDNLSVAEALGQIAIALNISFLEQEPGNVLLLPAGNQGPVQDNSGG